MTNQMDRGSFKVLLRAKSGVYLNIVRLHDMKQQNGLVFNRIHFENDVPLERAILARNNKWFYYCLKYRKCCICGKHADVCHIEVVGMGRNRQRLIMKHLLFTLVVVNIIKKNIR